MDYSFCLNAHVGYRSGTGLAMGGPLPSLSPEFLSSLNRVTSASVRYYKSTPTPPYPFASHRKPPIEYTRKVPRRSTSASLYSPLSTLEDRRSLIAALSVSMDHESKTTTHECETPVVQEGPVETKDRGMFDFLGKKKEGEETKQEEVMAAKFEEKVKVEDDKDKEKEKKHGLLEKLHRSGSSSSSSSDEEEGEDEEKKKKRKEKKDKKKKEEEEKKRHEEDTTVPVEKCEDPGAPAEEKKGFLDKIKEKMPGGQKKADEVPPPPPAVCPPAEPPCHDGSPREKKGILEKIKEKLPGYHPKSDEEKEKEKEGH